MRDINKEKRPVVGLRASAAVGMVTLALGVYASFGARPASGGVAGCTGTQLQQCSAFCNGWPSFCCFQNRLCWCTNGKVCNIQ